MSTPLTLRGISASPLVLPLARPVIARIARELGVLTVGGADLVGVAAHHHDEPGSVDLLRHALHVTEHRKAADLVQHLRPLGLHPRALARGQNDDSRLLHRIPDPLALAAAGRTARFRHVHPPEKYIGEGG